MKSKYLFILITITTCCLSASLAWTASPFSTPPMYGLPQCKAELLECEANTQAFPATGQTMCWGTSLPPIPCDGTGQDGEIQAGAPLFYTDNGDGTITDNNTKLMWEKKDDNNIGGIHDKDNLYSWEDAFIFVGTLNNICKSDETVDCSANGDSTVRLLLARERYVALQAIGTGGYRT